MTVGQLREEMSGGEFVIWSRYHARLAQRKELEGRRAQ
jgi:hypothetical protein